MYALVKSKDSSPVQSWIGGRLRDGASGADILKDLQAMKNENTIGRSVFSWAWNLIKQLDRVRAGDKEKMRQ